MATHDIDMTVPRTVVLKTDVNFSVRSDGRKVGELRVSRGSLAWKPAKSNTEYHIAWEELTALVQEHRNFTRRPR